MTERPLYSDSQIKIDYMRDKNGKLVTKGVNEIIIGKEKEGEILIKFVFPSEMLKELAKTPRNKLEGKLNIIDELIVSSLFRNKLTVDSLGVALSQAYIEELERYERDKDIESDLPI